MWQTAAFFPFLALLITLVEFAHAVTSLSPVFGFSLGFSSSRSSSRCLLLFNFAPVSGLDAPYFWFTLSFCIWVPLMVFLPPQWSVETKPECSA